MRTIPIFSPSAATAAAATTPVAAAVPDTAGMTSAFAEAAPPARIAPDNEIFHGLFSDPGRNGPVAAVVSQLWGAGSTPPAGGADGSTTPSGGTLMDLFKDNQRGT